jgi:hypothetical protein
MPILGVMSEILARELWSASGDEDFFSVARTIPFVASRCELYNPHTMFMTMTYP